MTSPLVSILMATCNSARYAGAAVESVLAQTFADFELIVADDCSSDATWEVLRPYASDPRVRLHRHERNLGEYPNRIWAAAQARGKYLIFLDGDDILYPHGLDLMTATLEAFPDAAFALSREWDERYIYPARLSPRELYRSVFLGRSVLACVFPYLLLRAEAYRAVGGLDPAVAAGDTHLCLRLAARYPCVLTWPGLAWWRRHAGQATQKIYANPLHEADMARYYAALLGDAACPLEKDERELAIRNVTGVFLRLVLRNFMRGRLGIIPEMLRRAALRPEHWANTWRRSRRPYSSDALSAWAGRLPDPPPPDWAKLAAARRKIIPADPACAVAEASASGRSRE